MEAAVEVVAAAAADAGLQLARRDRAALRCQPWVPESTLGYVDGGPRRSLIGLMHSTEVKIDRCRRELRRLARLQGWVAAQP